MTTEIKLYFGLFTPSSARAGLPPTFEQVRRELLRYAAKTKIKMKVSWLYDLFPKRPVVWWPL